MARKTNADAHFTHATHSAKARKFAQQADAASTSALDLMSRAQSLRELSAFHDNQAANALLSIKTITESEIIRRFVAALGNPPNITRATPISDLDPSGTNPLQHMCDLCNNYGPFAADKLNLSLSDLRTATKAGDIVDAIAADYQKRGWKVEK